MTTAVLSTDRPGSEKQDELAWSWAYYAALLRRLAKPTATQQVASTPLSYGEVDLHSSGHVYEVKVLNATSGWNILNTVIPAFSSGIMNTAIPTIPSGIFNTTIPTVYSGIFNTAIPTIPSGILNATSGWSILNAAISTIPSGIPTIPSGVLNTAIPSGVFGVTDAIRAVLVDATICSVLLPEYSRSQQPAWDVLHQIVSEIGGSIVDEERVESYLAQFPDIASVAAQLLKAARKQFGSEAKIVLEPYQDAEIDDQYLRILVRLPSYNEDFLEKLRMVTAASDEALAKTSGYVTITTDYRPNNGTL